MNPSQSERVVRPLTNPTAIASRLRWVAKQLMTEGGRSDQQAARANLYHAARQLHFTAIHGPIEGTTAQQWIDSGCNVLAAAILQRTNLEKENQ